MEAVSGGAGPRSGAGTARAPADGLVAGLVTPGGHTPQSAAGRGRIGRQGGPGSGSLVQDWTGLGAEAGQLRLET